MCYAITGLNVGVFFIQAEDGIRDVVRSRGLGDVYKRQGYGGPGSHRSKRAGERRPARHRAARSTVNQAKSCLLYTSDAADDLSCVDLGGRRPITKKKQT